MNLPNLKTITFFQYITIKERFIRRSLRYLKYTPFVELHKTGFNSKREVKELIDFQKRDLNEVLIMKKFEKIKPQKQEQK